MAPHQRPFCISSQALPTHFLAFLPSCHGSGFWVASQLKHNLISWLPVCGMPSYPQGSETPSHDLEDLTVCLLCRRG